jgi:hypothetical protein
MAIDFNAFLNRKYDIMGQEAGAKTLAAQNLGMPASPPPKDAPPVPKKNDSGTSLLNSSLGGSSLQNARSLLYTQDTSPITDRPYRPVGGAPDGNMMTRLDVSEDNISSTGRVGGLPGLKKGIARVPGKGDGTKDTVKAKLAPGEAVLNKAAADNMGRGLIAALNKMGAKKMGMV